MSNVINKEELQKTKLEVISCLDSIELLEIEVKTVMNIIHDLIHPWTISKYGKNRLRKSIQQYGMPEVAQAINIAAAQYLAYDEKGEAKGNSVDEFLEKYSGILYNRSFRTGKTT